MSPRWTGPECAEKTGLDPAATWRPPQPGCAFQPLLLSLQTSKEDEASWQTPEGDMTPGPPLPVSRDEPDFSKFISV